MVLLTLKNKTNTCKQIAVVPCVATESEMQRHVFELLVHGRESNSQPSDRESNGVTITTSRYTAKLDGTR